MNSKRLIFLQNLKQQDLSGDVPSVSPQVGEFLHHLVHLKQAKSILELGTAHAYSTIWLADAVENYQGHLTTIDVSAPSFKIATENIKKSGLEKVVTQHFGAAQEILPEITDTFDLILIDARKKDTKLFFDLCSPKLNPGGLIVVDDVEKFKTKMQSFWDFIENQSFWGYLVLPIDQDDSIMLVSKARTLS